MNSTSTVMKTWEHGMRYLDGWPPGVISLTLPVYRGQPSTALEQHRHFAAIEFKIQHAVRKADDEWWLMEEVVGDGVCVHSRKVRRV